MLYGRKEGAISNLARGRNLLRITVGLLAALYAATFVVAVLLHIGVEIPLGFAVLDEPRRPFAVIVEELAGVVLVLGAFAVFARKTWAWPAVTGAHAIALAGVLWGMVAVAAGRVPHTQLNDTYHRVMLLILGAGLILLLTPLLRSSLGRQRVSYERTRVPLVVGRIGSPRAPMNAALVADFSKRRPDPGSGPPAIVVPPSLGRIREIAVSRASKKEAKRMPMGANPCQPLRSSCSH